MMAPRMMGLPGVMPPAMHPAAMPAPGANPAAAAGVAAAASEDDDAKKRKRDATPDGDDGPAEEGRGARQKLRVMFSMDFLL